MKRYTFIRVWKDGIEIPNVLSLNVEERRPDPLGNPDYIEVDVRFETTVPIETSCKASSVVVEIEDSLLLLTGACK